MTPPAAFTRGLLCVRVAVTGSEEWTGGQAGEGPHTGPRGQACLCRVAWGFHGGRQRARLVFPSRRDVSSQPHLGVQTGAVQQKYNEVIHAALNFVVFTLQELIK